ncbi:MAG: nuclear transport factor 2 family protein [Gammaproteobacteria bacterium]|nr:nuclear transport factor 2 family protein [Gammaproteobacteria bacterium]
MLRDVLGNVLAPEATRFVDMMAEDGVMEFPFAPTGLTSRLDGRATVAAHLASLDGLVAFHAMPVRAVHRTTDPAVTIIEFDGTGRGLATERPYEQAYISVITVRQGRIALYRDYWNPLVILDAMGGDALQASFAQGGING